MAELKPCPFCGVDKNYLFVRKNEESFAQWYYVGCKNCDARGPEDIDEAEAISAWNKRSKKDEKEIVL